jgi:hypothetical protein
MALICAFNMYSCGDNSLGKAKTFEEASKVLYIIVLNSS